MNTTKISVTSSNIEKYTGDLLVFCIEQPEKGLPGCDERVQPQMMTALELGDFTAKTGNTLLIYPPLLQASVLSAKRLLLVGLGKIYQKTDSDCLREVCRKVGGDIARHCEKIKATSIMICLPEITGLKPSETAECITEGLLLGDYRFLKYKSEDKEEKPYGGLKKLTFQTLIQTTGVRKGVDRGTRAALAARKARDMANEPGNGWTPRHFVTYAKELADFSGMTLQVLENEDMQRLGMGGILAVNQGSAEPAKMIVLEYRPFVSSGTILLVGKGLTFDSGGVSLKPAAGMQDMKYDMCGGAAVLAAMQVIALEKPDIGVVAIVPATDNMAGGAAVKPGDIIVHFNGVTSEIVNTDAEGRMILADALAYGIDQYHPVCVIDLATLTGAVLVALGHHYTGILGNNPELIGRVIAAGKRCGEPLWQLPLGAEYNKQIESEVADIKNTGGKTAGTITAAAYLQKFVKDTPWVHLDIAGTAWEFTEKSYIPKGPSGIGVRTLVELVRSWEEWVPAGKS